MALKERIRANQREAATREEMRRRHFEARFNTLVDAVSQFAKEYNAGHGGIWPQRQADILRKAMLELQSLEATLARGGERSPACATDVKR
ncbi:hypothetical protein [uncultured Paludibaculum sp.]|uniref:hypothetical protein n=1 Tax=uncultured Paludibaculum sp. TaxID=1765020 RepID=UPI002AABF62F|nr:hypothetical protein [uncultured Paludibaculum sp.]